MSMTSEHDAPREIATMTGSTFDRRVLEAPGPVVVEFMAYGCEHCRAIEPIVREVAAQLKGRETIVRVNVGVETDLADLYEIRSTPTFVMFLDGAQIGRCEGPKPNVAALLAAVTEPFDAGRTS